MKRITLISILSVLGAFCAQAGNINSQVLKDNNFRNSLWMESSNTAGLAFRPFDMYKDLDLKYENNSGDFHASQDASNINNISLNTSGSAHLGKFTVWGKFSFSNIFEKGRNMNALMYETEVDMPYYPIDTTKNSPWTKQAYNLQAKLISPVLWNLVSFGIDVNYVNNVGAKQLDPRAETYRYYINLKPSAAFRFGKNLIGLNAVYKNGFERSKPSNENNWVSQAVYLHKGLGEAVRGKVGDNDGIKEYMFTNNMYGGGLQYGYCGNVELFADLGFVIKKTDVVSQPKLPKKEGSTNKKEINADIKFLFGEYKSDNLWIKANYGKTGGTEYIQKLTVESATDQYWNVISSNVMSSYKNMTASLGYDHQFGASDARGYDWVVGGQADFLMRKDIYNLPISKFKATTVAADVFGGKQFKFKASSLLVKIDGGYGKSLGSEYIYGGTNPKYESVNMYKAESEYYSTDYAKAGCRVAYTINTKRLGFVINAAADYIKPLGATGHRLYANTSFGILF